MMPTTAKTAPAARFARQPADPAIIDLRRFAYPFNSGLGHGAKLGHFPAMHFANTVLWIYIILLLVGGLIGFLKAGSKVSLITSAVFAALLTLCALDVVFKSYVASILLAVLLVVFAIRLAKTKKFMPSGMMLVVTGIALALRNIQF
jgi:uncharacterized membrane protein (UPF0136 family)